MNTFHLIRAVLLAGLLAFCCTGCEPDEPVVIPVDTGQEGGSTVTTLRMGPSHDTVFEVGGIRFNMVYVNGGSFTMGATTQQGAAGYDPDADADEMPPHTVSLSSFLIADVEVSQFLFFSVMGFNPSQISDLNLPVHNLNFYMAQRFLDTLSAMTGFGFRMPTEAEWEYAAKGGYAHAPSSPYFSGSRVVDSVAWSVLNSDTMLHESALLAPNALGLYDMSGNVREWCSDWKASYSSETQIDPQGPDRPANVNLQRHIVRGGSFKQMPYYLRVTARQSAFSSAEENDIGLRLVLPVRK